MYETIEKKCTELFGTCPLTIQDFQAAKGFGYSDEELIYEAARKFRQNEEKDFVEKLEEWKNGDKYAITEEDAKKRNSYVKNAERVIMFHNLNATFIDAPINWTAFPYDDPKVVLYMGYPFECELCQWASNYRSANPCEPTINDIIPDESGHMDFTPENMQAMKKACGPAGEVFTTGKTSHTVTVTLTDGQG